MASRKSSQQIADAIEEMKAKLVEAQKAEEDARWRELTRLIKRADALDDAIAWARERNDKAKGKRITARETTTSKDGWQV